MRAVDDAQWAQQESDLRLDGEAGENFLRYFDFWFTTADTMLAEERLTPVEAMRRSLDLAEAALGFLTVDLLGQMLTLAMVHWEHGSAMLAAMTNIEHRVLETALARKVVSLQQEAEFLEQRSGTALTASS